MNLIEQYEMLTKEEEFKRLPELVLTNPDAVCVSINEEPCKFLQIDHIYKSSKGSIQFIGVCQHKDAKAISREAGKKRWYENRTRCLCFEKGRVNDSHK